MENFLYAARIGTWVVDALPILNYLPKLLAPWKRYADKLHDFESKLAQKYEGWPRNRLLELGETSSENERVSTHELQRIGLRCGHCL